MTGWLFFPCLSYLINILPKCQTWHLLDVITSNLNLVWWSRLRPCVHHHGMTTDVFAPSCISSHKQYINSDINHHNLFCGYGIFLSLSPAILYLRIISVYNLCISFLFPLSPQCGDIFLFHFPFSSHCTLFYLLLFSRWIRLFLLLSICWTQIILGLK